MVQQGDELIQTQAGLRDLKRAVLALRQELENAHAEADARLRKSAVAAKAEAAQLESTVVALREELERARAERETAVQQAASANYNDIQQLKATIAAPRICTRARSSRLVATGSFKALMSNRVWLSWFST